MKKLLAIVAFVMSLLLTAGNTALAQTGDAQLDGNGHPNVGAFLLPRLTDGSLRIICSGTLVTPRVFLTASHCTAFALSQGFTRTWVTFDPNFGTNPDHSIMTTRYPGTIVHNPASNLRLRSGVAPVPQMLGRGIPVAVGMDGMSMSDQGDYFQDLRLAAALQFTLGDLERQLCLDQLGRGIGQTQIIEYVARSLENGFVLAHACPRPPAALHCL